MAEKNKIESLSIGSSEIEIDLNQEPAMLIGRILNFAEQEKEKLKEQARIQLDEARLDKLGSADLEKIIALIEDSISEFDLAYAELENILDGYRADALIKEDKLDDIANSMEKFDSSLRENSGRIAENIDNALSLKTRQFAESLESTAWSGLKFAVPLIRKSKGDHYTTFDAITSLGLLHEAGVLRLKRIGKNLKRNADVEYTNERAVRPGAVNIARGGKRGLQIDEDKSGAPAYSINPDENSESAARQIYRLLVQSGKIDIERLEKDGQSKNYFERAIDFLESAMRDEISPRAETEKVDAEGRPLSREWYRNNYSRTLRGLWRGLTDERKIEQLFRFFEDGNDPDQPLDDSQLEKYKLKEIYNKKENKNFSEHQQSIVDESLDRLEDMEARDLIISSRRYGRIAVVINRELPGGFEAAQYYGCGAYIYWNKEREGFVIKTAKPITEEFVQGRKSGDKKVFKHEKEKSRIPDDQKDIFVTLEEIIGKLTGGEYEVTDSLYEYYQQESRTKLEGELKQLLESYGEREDRRIMLKNLLQRIDEGEFSLFFHQGKAPDEYSDIKREIERELDKLEGEEKSERGERKKSSGGKGEPEDQEQAREPAAVSEKSADKPVLIEKWYTVVKPDGSYDFADIKLNGFALRLIDRDGSRRPTELKVINSRNEIVLIISNGRAGFDAGNLTESDLDKIAFWAGHGEMLPAAVPELAKIYFKMAEQSGQAYDSPEFIAGFLAKKDELIAAMESEKSARAEPAKDERYFRSKYEYIMAADLPDEQKDRELLLFYQEIGNSEIDRSLFFRTLQAERRNGESFEQLERIIRGLEQNNKTLAKEMIAEDLVEEIERLRAEARTREIYEIDLVLIPEEYGIRDALRELLKKEYDEFNQEHPVMVLPDDDAPMKAKSYVVAIEEIMKDYAHRIADRKKQEVLHATERGMASTGESRFWSVMENVWGGFSRLRKWGKKSIVTQTEDAYYKKYYSEAYEAISRHQNLLIDLNENYRLGKKSEVKDPDFKRDIHFEELDKIIQGYQRNAVELEERGNMIEDARAHSMFKTMISHAVRFNWDRQKFERVQKEYINYMKKKGYLTDLDIYGQKREQEGKDAGNMFATNFYELTRSYKLHRIQKVNGIIKDHNLKKSEQVKALEEHINKVMQLEILAGAKLAEIKNKRADKMESWMEKALIKMQNIPIIGRIASNPGVAAAIASMGATAGSRWALRIMAGGALAATGAATVAGGWAPILAAMAAGGIVGGIRRSKQVKDDLAMHKRDKTLGQKFYDFRRIRAERFDYDTKNTRELRETLASIIGDPKNPRKFSELDDEEKKALAAVYSRFRVENDRYREYTESLADKKKFKKPVNRTVDLISVEGEEGEKYGSVLMSKTDLKIELYDYLRANGLIKEEGSELSGNRQFNEFVEREKKILNDNVDEMDKKADSYRRKSAMTMGTIYGLSSAAGAMAGQEIFSRFADYKGWRPRFTALDSIRDYFRQPGGKKIDSMLDKLMMGKDPMRPGLNKVGPFSIFISQNNTIDPAQTNLPSGWKVAPDGKGIIREALGGLGSLKPGVQEIVVGGQKLEVLVNPDGKGFDTAKPLPAGWRYGPNGESLIHSVAGKKETIDASNFQNFARHIMGDKYTGQRVSYSKFMYQGSAPDKGIRGLPEILENRAHNRRLRANFTELMMHYKQAENGDVIVDVKQMFGKLLKADLKEVGIEMQKAIRSGKKFSMLLSLDNTKGGTQHTPIEFIMEKPGEIRIPKEAAKYFFAFDKSGKLLQGSGRHPGLHSFVMDTGEVRQKDGARKVIQIASTYGKKPDFEFEIPGKEEEYPISQGGRIDLSEIPGKKFGPAYGFMPVAGSRWQLEDQRKSGDAGKKKKNERRREAASAGLQTSLHELVSAIKQREHTREDLIHAIEESLSAEETESARRISGIKLIAEGGFADALWERNKAVFTDRINLKRIFGKRLSVRFAGEIYNKLISLEKDYRENGKIANTGAEAIEIAVYYNNYGKTVYHKNALTFGEFMFCIKRTLEERLKIRKIKDQLAGPSAVASADRRKNADGNSYKPADKNISI